LFLDLSRHTKAQTPRILARAVEIRPVVTLLAMIAGSQVFGVW